MGVWVETSDWAGYSLAGIRQVGPRLVSHLASRPRVTYPDFGEADASPSEPVLCEVTMRARNATYAAVVVATAALTLTSCGTPNEQPILGKWLRDDGAVIVFEKGGHWQGERFLDRTYPKPFVGRYTLYPNGWVILRDKYGSASSAGKPIVAVWVKVLDKDHIEIYLGSESSTYAEEVLLYEDAKGVRPIFFTKPLDPAAQQPIRHREYFPFSPSRFTRAR